MNAASVRRTRVDVATERIALCLESGEPLSFAQVIASWADVSSFRLHWRDLLRDVPFGAYAWECPPVTEATGSRPFECVFVASPALEELPPEPGAFAAHCHPGCEVATFPNLGGDAILVAPCPGGGDFRHLARFTDCATAGQSGAFWQAVGAAMRRRLGDRPVWLSTAGLGVGWLHARLDDRPKYYRHAPYARA